MSSVIPIPEHLCQALGRQRVHVRTELVHHLQEVTFISELFAPLNMLMMTSKSNTIIDATNAH